jgi:hypothetical protein
MFKGDLSQTLQKRRNISVIELLMAKTLLKSDLDTGEKGKISLDILQRIDI